MKRYTRWFRSIALLVLAAFSFTFVLPTSLVAAEVQENRIENMMLHGSSGQLSAATLRTELAQASQALQSEYMELRQSIAGNEADLAAEQLDKLLAAIEESRAAIAEEFEQHRGKLSAIQADQALARQAAYEQQVNQSFDELQSKLDGLRQAWGGESNLATARSAMAVPQQSETLEQQLAEIDRLIAPEKPENAIGTHTLPFRNLAEEPTEPIGASPAPAAEAFAVQARDIAALPELPNSADLAETPETAWSESIQELADSLGPSPLALYEYVRNQIDFEPYYGSRKGAQGTLEQLVGNDYDQASLLIALLRYHDIPARYATGTVEIPASKAMNWAGADTPEAAVRALGAAGIPVTALVSGGEITAVLMEHVWVEAYIPYENYRGAGERNGESVWVPLDPSYKQYESVEGLNLESFTSLDSESILDIIESANRSGDESSLTNLDLSSYHEAISQSIDNLQSYAEEHLPEDAQLSDVIGGRSIVEEHLGVLPLSLPYDTEEAALVLQEVPDELSDRVTFSIRGADPFGFGFSGSQDFSYQAKAVELYGKRITLAWEPATEEDQAILDEYGGVFQTPAYLVKVKPVLRADGEVLASGKAVGLGYNQQFTITMHSPGKSPQPIVNPVTAGAIYAVGLDYGKVSADELNGIHANIQQLKDSGLTEDTLYNDQAMGEILNAAVKTYFAQLDVYDDVLAEQYGVASTSLLKEAMTGYQVNVSYLFMSPVEVSAGGMYIDVDHHVVAAVSKTDGKDDRLGYMMASGMLASVMENGIFEQLTGVPSVSSIKILLEANERGVPIHTVDADNINDVLPRLTLSSAVKNDISNAINQGRIAIVPEHNIQYYDWNGAGYILMDLDSGAAGYMISGGTAGGSTAMVVDLASIIALLDVILSVIVTISLLLSGTGLGIILGLAMLALTLYYVYEITQLMLDYYLYGNTEAGQQLIGNAIMSLLGAMAGGVLGKAIPGMSKFLGEALDTVKQLMRNADPVEELAERYSDDFIEEVLKRSGSEGAEEASQLVKTLEDAGVSRELIEDVGQSAGKEGLEQVQKLLDEGLSEAQIRQLLGSDIGLENAAKLADNQILPDDYARLGIDSGAEANAVSKLLDNGLDKATIETLSANKIKPSYFEKLGVHTPEGAARYLDDLSKGQPASQIANGTAQYPNGDVWSKTPFTRGKDIDNLLGNNLGDNFPVIDKFDAANRTITSIKSFDTTLVSHQGSGLYQNIKSAVDDLNGFTSQSWNGRTITETMYDNKVLEIAVPDVTLTGSQVSSLNQAIQYANNLGIDITITIVK